MGDRANVKMIDMHNNPLYLYTQGETGYGISTHVCDNEHAVIVLDPKTKRIWLETESGNRRLFEPQPFEAFVNDPAALFDAYECAEWSEVRDTL